MRWRQNPTRIAWFILLANFFACCVLTVAVPLGVRSILLHATSVHPGFVTATTGTAQLWLPNAREPTAVTERRQAPEGSRLITDATAKAVLTVGADESGSPVISTIQLSPDTAIGLQRLRAPRFTLSPDPYQFQLALNRGRVYVATQKANGRNARVRLGTPHTEIILQDGTFDVQVDGDETQVRVRSGTALIGAEGRFVTANGGERVSVAAGGAPAAPVPDTLNLVLNGGFEGALAPLWEEFAEVKPGYNAGHVEVGSEGPRRTVTFSRRTEDGVPNRVGVRQIVDRDVQGYDTLGIRLDLKVVYQSVPGGGEKATEYPVMVDLAYTDVYGKELHWYQGFYYLDLPPGSPYLPPTGEKVPLGVWYSYESPNLFTLLSETRPARINAVSIYAIGHDYESLASDLALTVR